MTVIGARNFSPTRFLILFVLQDHRMTADEFVSAMAPLCRFSPALASEISGIAQSPALRRPTVSTPAFPCGGSSSGELASVEDMALLRSLASVPASRPYPQVAVRPPPPAPASPCLAANAASCFSVAHAPCYNSAAGHGCKRARIGR